jgi:exopolysaccharide biosynthesis polyprenyl glycosylphosphotransferase
MNLAIGRLKLSLVVADVLIALVSNVLAGVLRFGAISGYASGWALPYSYVVLALVVLLWPVVLQWQGAYEPLRLKTSKAEAFEVLRAGGLYAAGLLALQALVHAYAVSRIFLGLFFAILIVLTLISRAVIHEMLAWLRAHGRNYRRVLIVGAGPQGRWTLDRLQSHPELGLRVVGFVDDRSPERLGRKLGAPHMGRLADLPEILKSHVVDEVLVTLPFSTFGRLQRVMEACNQEGKNVYLAVDGLAAARGAIARSRLAEVDGVPFLGLIYAPDHMPALVLKRAIDLVLSVISLVVSSPFLLVIAGLIHLDSPGPVIFRQERVGLHGRRFTLFKFRTMMADAEEQLGRYLARNEMRGPVFKLRDDPRVTRVGRWLRRLSLDELPQLWNVLAGDMSLVGPRPPLPREVAQYDGWHRRRLSVRPGITGPWQVAGRNDVPQFDRWVEMELDYIDHWNLWLDVKILLHTVSEVLAFHGR